MGTVELAAPTQARGKVRAKIVTGERWVGVGSAHGSDADAAAGATADALDGRDDAKLLVVFCTDEGDLAATLAGIERVSGGDVPLIGCSTAGEIATDGPSEAGVVVTAFGGEGFSATTAVASKASTRLREAGEEVARAVTAADPPATPTHRVLLLLTDGLAGDQQEIVRGAHAVLGAAVPLVGGCAGDGLKMQRTFQLHGGELLTDTVVAACLDSTAPFGIGVRHGWRRVGEPMLVTESGGNRVVTLDDEPAVDVYLDRLDAPQTAREDPAAFTRFALTHPLGMSRRTGEEQVRFIGGADFDTGSLSTIAEVPQGALVWLMEGDEQSVLDATDAACDVAANALGGRPPLAMLAFDCVARKGVLGDDGLGAEIERIAARAGGAPVAGFYTYGEIARTSGVSGFHNQTLVVLAVS
jgi:hypothetical protein